jgi:hypothetical protein
MLARILFATVATAASAYGASFQQIERTLTNLIRWEILWRDTPKGFQIPSAGSATLFIGETDRNVSYCSHEMGVCATYLLDPMRNWQRTKVSRCDGNESDESALVTFVTGEVKKAPPLPAPRHIVIGQGGLSGTPTTISPVRWGTTIRVESRPAVIEEYKGLKPTEAGSLRAWLLAHDRGAGYRSVTFGCFKSSDPQVFVYGQRLSDAPIIFSVFWNRDQEDWVEASLLRQPQLPKEFEEMKSTIEAIACGTIKFE